MINRKKTVGSALIILILAMAVMPAQAFGPGKWTIGYEKNTNGPKKGVQGTNGWYFMYSTETATDGQLDASKVKECVWADKGSCWMWYDYDKMWMPDIYATDRYDCLNQNGWWRMDENGIMDPNVMDGSIRSVIAWEAPEDGTYNVNLDYTAGTLPFNWYGEAYSEGDGLTLSLSTDMGTVDKAFCGVAKKSTDPKKAADIPEGNINREITLKKGERLYVSADPGQNGGSDVADIQMEIVQDKGESVRSFMMTILTASIAAVVIIAAGIVIIILKGRREDRDSEENLEEDIDE